MPRAGPAYMQSFGCVYCNIYFKKRYIDLSVYNHKICNGLLHSIHIIERILIIIRFEYVVHDAYLFLYYDIMNLKLQSKLSLSEYTLHYCNVPKIVQGISIYTTNPPDRQHK